MTSTHPRRLRAACTVAALVAAVGIDTGVVAATRPRTQTVKYDAANLDQYTKLWSNTYGPLELDAGGTRTVSGSGTTVSAEPFHVGADYSVYDHLKYIAISNQSFAVPESGSLEFSVDITAQVSGTDPDRPIHGCYGPPGSYESIADTCDDPFVRPVLEGMQAGVVLNMVNFATGQLFDWFVSGSTAFALIERLPSNVTGSGNVGLDLAYTQIIVEVPIEPGLEHKVAIRYSRGPKRSRVEYFLDGGLVATVDDVGVPLDVQGEPFTGFEPSYGPGEELKDQLDSFVIGHGLFSLLDAFPYQHPEAPELSVSIPMSERLFGQGATGTWDDFVVTTRSS